MLIIPKDVPGTKLSVTGPLRHELTNSYVKAIKLDLYCKVKQ